MKRRLINGRVASAFALTLVLWLSASAANEQSAGKRIEFSTKSKEAREHVAQIVQGIETFRFPQEWLPLAQKIVALDPEFAFGHYLLATALGPQPESRQHSDKAVELAKTASEGERRYIEAVFLARSQKPAEALAIFRELEKQYPEERMVQMMIGQVCMNQGKLDEAKSALESAIKLDGSTPRAYTFLGNVCLLNAEYVRARQLFDSALAKKAKGTAPFGAYYGLAYAHIYQGDLESALKPLNAFKDEYTRLGGAPNLPAVFIWNSIARVLLESGRPAEAIKAYEKGYETVPGSSLSEQDKKIWLGRLHHGKGRALSKLGRHDEAWKEAELIKKMIEEAGQQGEQFLPAYHYIAGYLKLESGKHNEAIEHLKQADQGDPFHKLLLARAYEKSGNHDNAQKLYRDIVAFNQLTLERALAFPEAKKKLKG